MIELKMENAADREEKFPQVFEAMGGYSPTVGILGAVLGLIQVKANRGRQGHHALQARSGARFERWKPWRVSCLTTVNCN